MAAPYSAARSMLAESDDEIEVSGPGYSLKRPVKTALHQAVLDCRIHQVRLLVEKHGGNVDARDMFGKTPLTLACLLDNEEYGYRMMKIFMRAGAYLNMRDNMNRTALHYACMKGREAIVKRLLKEDNLDLSLQDNDGNNALMHASLSGNPLIVDLVLAVMIRFGLNVDERNGLGYTALLLACKFGHYVSAHILLTKGDAQPDLRDTEGYHTAAEWVRKSSHMRNAYLPSRSQTVMEIPMNTLSFTREKTMYTERESRSSGGCRHAPMTAPNPLGRSIGSALQLPNIFKGFHVNRNSETLIEGRNARDILLEDIEHVISNRRSALRRQHRMRSFRSISGISSNFVRAAPSTAKLRSLQSRTATAADGKNSRAATVADIRLLFKLYSDQFENWKTPHPSRDGSHRVRFDTAQTQESDIVVRENTNSSSNVQQETPAAV